MSSRPCFSYDAFRLANGSSAELWLARVQLELSQIAHQRLAVVHDSAARVFDRALADDAVSNADKVKLWAQYWTLANDFGHDARSLLDIRRRYAAFRRSLHRYDDTREPRRKKLKPREPIAVILERAAATKPNGTSDSTPSAYAAYGSSVSGAV